MSIKITRDRAADKAYVFSPDGEMEIEGANQLSDAEIKRTFKNLRDAK